MLFTIFAYFFIKLHFLPKIHPECRYDANRIKTENKSKMTDMHAAEYSKTVCLGVNMHKLLIQQYSQETKLTKLPFLFVQVQSF